MDKIVVSDNFSTHMGIIKDTENQIDLLSSESPQPVQLKYVLPCEQDLMQIFKDMFEGFIEKDPERCLANSTRG